MAAATAESGGGELGLTVVRTALVLVGGAMAVIFDTTIVSAALRSLAARVVAKT